MSGAGALEGRIRDAIGPFEQLPSLPDSVLEVMRAIQRDEPMARIAEQIARDVALTTRVMRVANSPLYGTRGAKTVAQAVGLIGLGELSSIVLAIGVVSSLAPARAGGRLSYADFWSHCAATSALAAALAARSDGGRSAAAADEHALTGLVHDVGVPILAQRLGARYDELLAENGRCGEPLSRTERRTLGFSHLEVGGLALEQWRLPAATVAAARWHHEPLEAGPGVRRDASLVHLADALAKHTGRGVPEVSAEVVAEAGLTAAALSEAAADFRASRAERLGPLALVLGA